jgi:hypothetical protein
LIIVAVWFSRSDANSGSSGKYINNKYRFSIEFPNYYQDQYLPNNGGVYFRPKNRPVWEQTVISVMVLPHDKYLPPMKDYKDITKIISERDISGKILQRRLADSEYTGKLIESVIDRGDYTIQLIYNMPDKISGLIDYDKIVDSLKIW